MNGISDQYTCGMDEAGRGPVLGPMVIAIVCGARDKLAGTGARDSKMLPPASRERIAGKIMKAAQHFDKIIIEPNEIDRQMELTTLNEIEYTFYMKLLSNSPGHCRVYVDAFDVREDRLQARMRLDSGREVICRHGADKIFPEVSAASIIAKVARDSEIEKLHEKYGDFGSGYPSDPRTVKFLEDAIRDGIDIGGIVRKKWKTYINLLNSSSTERLF
ncbi:MAG: ribonuclease HII [Candidatus Thermoplasmatota archaeon]|nr:ribonuclease HII [Candidatus Thermoplasmatota archaeon]